MPGRAFMPSIGDTRRFPEPIRLVIWDLDETFWYGTLEEGDVEIPTAHIDIVIELARRGIVSSICSKNDATTVRSRLERDGVWRWFVFPAIEYTRKSGLVASIIEQMELRPEAALLIDDNPFNLGDVVDRVPGVNAVSHEFIPDLLDHPQLLGKSDPGFTHLNGYKMLETRQRTRPDAGSMANG
jgi:predicted enzyme involved in methoxymalonyl-ACP biosynthesis